MIERSMSGDFDVETPNVARMYDFYLGGKDNYAADRAAALEVLKSAPQTPALAMENRAFLGRAVRHLAVTAGIGQFLDIGTGLPTQGNVHEVAQAALPGARVVYVDKDPIVLSHARALLAGAPDTRVVAADMRDPATILDDPATRAALDFTRPVAVLAISMLHCLTDAEDPWASVARLRDALAPGSFLVLSHITAEDEPAAAKAGADVYRRANMEMTLRSRDAIARFFDGFEILDPGLVRLVDWRPGNARAPRDDLPTWFLCGVGRKP
jgi:SAM-dependent methyltransferase